MAKNSTWKHTLERLTTAQRDTAEDGENAIIFNTTTGQIEYWNGSAWVSTGSGGGSESVISASVSGDYNIDVSLASYWDLTLTGNTTLTVSSIPSSGTGKTIAIRVTGAFTLTVPSEFNVDVSSYGSGPSLITVAFFGNAQHFGAFNAG